MKLDKIAFARVIGFIERTHALNMTPTQIQDLDVMIDVDAPAPEQIYPKNIHVEELMEAMFNNKKIDAIRAFRMLTGMPLKESKDVVEKYWVSRDLYSMQPQG